MKKTFKSHYFYISVVFLATIAVYAQSLSFDFVWDDLYAMLNSRYINSAWSNIWDIFIPGRVSTDMYSPI